MAKSKALTVRSGGDVAMPEDWMGEMGKEAVAGAARVPVTSNRWISIKGGKFSLGETILTSPIRVVVVDFALENAYYKEKWDPNNIASPVCFALSLGDVDGGRSMVPDSSSPEQQNDKCETCDQNKFGSAETGKGKACKNSVRLALLEADTTDPEQASIAFLRCPPTSVGGFSKFVRETAAQSGNTIAYFGVIVEVSFDPNPKLTYPILVFKRAEIIKSGALARMVLTHRKTVREQLLAPFVQREIEEAPAAKSNSGAKPTKRKFSK
jgi:hypothetical protein